MKRLLGSKARTQPGTRSTILEKDIVAFVLRCVLRDLAFRISTLVFLLSAFVANSQSVLMFGTVKIDGKTSQGRFEVVRDGTIKSIVYAPYGITPVTFLDVTQDGNHLKFAWPVGPLTYKCVLEGPPLAYRGSCTCEKGGPIEIIIREFTKQDANLQGDSLRASAIEIKILDRALQLLNNGTNWNRNDARVCDNSSYPYKWSLFCALHQASIDLDGEYRHLRPAVQATRQAINEITSGKKYAHLLQDYNNEAQSFEAISKALNRGKEIMGERIKLGK